MESGDDGKNGALSLVEENVDHKYDRLVAENNKMRSQLIVLKNVILEEKAANSELKNQTRQKDQAIRRLEQETESLRFCNGQISTRLVVLQNDLKEHEARMKSKSKKQPQPMFQDGSSFSAPDLHEDFVQLVTINARLSQELSSLQSNFDEKCTKLEEEKNRLEVSANRCSQELNDYKNMYDSLELRIKTEAEKSFQKEISELKLKVHDLSIENDRLQDRNEKIRSEIAAIHQHNIDTAHQGELVKQLTHQIESQKSRLLKLQQEKEKWTMDFQLSRFKNQQGSLGADVHTAGTQPHYPDEHGDGHLRCRIEGLVVELQHADGKASLYQAECSALMMKMDLAEQSRLKTVKDLSDAQQHIVDLKRHLETTVIKTNEQISLLTEHLATMNEKLQDRTDEINALKFELHNHQTNSKSKKP
ncbi:hypothetical protein RvY_05187 [Ramazzottius varieornatus]|uniref:Protein phosphatase 1 regulatory subunit 21 N-terminal domain-containing protein n=1 Tax=Ramazzottius varieornatus TaxID=947166 RepID=A0A1D1UU85_RAMVA|nr:hypothetical protein RvY_05187 [Ramazzottius varieornatus]